VDDPEQLRASRARLAAALLDGRRRTERALHDGVLQDLTALTVELQLARGDAALEDVRRELHAALDRVRALADDVYPSILDGRGLADALRAAARAAGLSASVETDGGRAAPDVEAAAFFACAELFARTDAGAEVTATLRHADGGLRVELTGVHGELAQSSRDLVDGLEGALVVRV